LGTTAKSKTKPAPPIRVIHTQLRADSLTIREDQLTGSAPEAGPYHDIDI